MRVFSGGFVLLLAAAMISSAAAQRDAEQRPAAAEQLFALANMARARAGAPPLVWDQALTQAALQHCRRMAAEGPIAHRYGGEPSLTERTAAAGAHFSLIEENVAVGPDAPAIHEGWMHSPGHRENLLNPQADHVGIAVVASRGVLYAVADYSRAVPLKSPAQVESAIGELVQMTGVRVRRNPHDARLACGTDDGLPAGLTGGQPGFVMRWQGADLEHLPQALVDRLGSGRYHDADVGSCASHSADREFTSYRVAVLLY